MSIFGKPTPPPPPPPTPVPADASQRKNARPTYSSLVGSAGAARPALQVKASTQKSSLIGGAR